MCEMVYINKPEQGIDCRYWKERNEIYGVCNLPANKGEWCNKFGWVNSKCPLPGWDYLEQERGKNI